MNLKEIILKNKYLIVIIFLGLFLRVYALGNMGLTSDEGTTLQQAKDLSNVFKYSQTVEMSPPLYFLTTFVVYQIFHDVLFVRLISVIMGTFLILLVYILTKRLFEENAALIAAFLVAINPNLIAFSYLLRTYSFFFVLMFLIMIFSKKYIETKKDLLHLAVCNALLLLTTYFSFLILTAEFLALKINKIKNAVILKLLAVIFIILLPLSVIILNRMQFYNSFFITTDSSAFGLGRIFFDMAYSFYRFSAGKITIQIIKENLLLSPILLAAIILVLFLFIKGVWFKNSKITVLHYFLAIPLVLSFGFSFFGFPINFYPYTSYMLPMFLIFAANGLAKIKNAKLQALLLVIISISWFFSLLIFYSTTPTQTWTVN